MVQESSVLSPTTPLRRSVSSIETVTLKLLSNIDRRDATGCAA